MIYTNPQPFPNSTGRSCSFVQSKSLKSSLPVLYQLHGQFDTEEDWWEKKGNLKQILNSVHISEMLIVMPFCSDEKKADPRQQNEPPLDKFIQDFFKIRKEIIGQFGIPVREAILGISMGGKQALSIVLEKRNKFSALGVLSGKFQGDNYDKEIKNRYPLTKDFNGQMDLYYHYCGNIGQNETSKFENNKKICEKLGGQLQINEEGQHNWNFWNPELEKFISRLSEAWQSKETV